MYRTEIKERAETAIERLQKKALLREQTIRNEIEERAEIAIERWKKKALLQEQTMQKVRSNTFRLTIKQDPGMRTTPAAVDDFICALPDR